MKELLSLGKVVDLEKIRLIKRKEQSYLFPNSVGQEARKPSVEKIKG